MSCQRSRREPGVGPVTCSTPAVWSRCPPTRSTGWLPASRRRPPSCACSPSRPGTRPSPSPSWSPTPHRPPTSPRCRRTRHALAARFWPGALTLVLPRRADFAVDLGGSGATVGVRSPAHLEVIELCRRLGPLATTSANRSGRPTPPDGVGVVARADGDRRRPGPRRGAVPPGVGLDRRSDGSQTGSRCCGLGRSSWVSCTPPSPRPRPNIAQEQRGTSLMPFWKKPSEGVEWLGSLSFFDGFGSDELTRRRRTERGGRGSRGSAADGPGRSRSRVLRGRLGGVQRLHRR